MGDFHGVGDHSYCHDCGRYMRHFVRGKYWKLPLLGVILLLLSVAGAVSSMNMKPCVLCSIKKA